MKKTEIKGKATIQLFDKDSNKLVYESIDENIVTDAVKRIVTLEGKEFLKGHRGGATNIPYYHLSNITPVATQLFGGILLFGNNIDEFADTMFPPVGSQPIGNAGSPYAGTNPYRGSYNQAESGIIYSGTSPIGYRHVWDFNTDRANGSINCLCLTSVIGGNTGWKSRKLSYTSNGPDFDADSILEVPLVGSRSLPLKPFSTPVLNRDTAVIERCITNDIIARLLYVDEAEGYVYFALPYSTSDPGRIIRVRHSSTFTLNAFDEVNPYQGVPYETYLVMNKIGFNYLRYMEFDKSTGGVRYITVQDSSSISDETYRPSIGIADSNMISIAGSGSSLTLNPGIPPFYYKGFYYAQTTDSRLIKISSTGVIEQTFDISGLAGGSFIPTYSDVLDRIVLRSTSHSYSYMGVAILFDGFTLETFKTGDNDSNTLYVTANCSNPSVPGSYLGTLSLYSPSSPERLLYQFYSNYLATVNNLSTPVIKTSATTMKITYDIYTD